MENSIMRFLQSNQLALAVSVSLFSLSATMVFAQAGFLTSRITNVRSIYPR